MKKSTVRVFIILVIIILLVTSLAPIFAGVGQ